MRRIRVLLLCTTALLVIAGCTADRQSDDVTTPDEPMATQPEAGSDDIEETPEPTGDTDDLDSSAIATSTSAFGFELFNGLADQRPDENVITSPYSAAVLLTMLLSGADGETREAIGDALQLDDPFDETITRQHQVLAESLSTADPDVELAVANSLWANEGTPFVDEYLEEMRDRLMATVEEIDLGNEEAVEQIDEWVSEQTRDRIEEMAEALGVPDPNLVLVLLNAVYFLGDWTEPFDPEQTREGTFTTAGGHEVEVSFMNQDDAHQISMRDDYQMLRLPYGDEERFAMDVLLPDEGNDIHALRDHLTVDEWQDAANELNETRVNVTLPSFELEYESDEDLDEVLHDLGMGIAYSGSADFAPMSSVAPFLSTVQQKTYIRVDEEGTEAAAVTGGAMVESMPPEFRADRPFLFMISDVETGVILFMGQVADPSE
jgi:serine protease inhibitor